MMRKGSSGPKSPAPASACKNTMLSSLLVQGHVKLLIAFRRGRGRSCPFFSIVPGVRTRAVAFLARPRLVPVTGQEPPPKLRKGPLPDGGPDVHHEPLQKGQVVPGGQAQGQHLAAFEQVADVGA